VCGTGLGQTCACCQTSKAKCKWNRGAPQTLQVVLLPRSSRSGETSLQQGAAQEKQDAKLIAIQKRQLALEEVRDAEQAQQEDCFLAMAERSATAMENLASAIWAHGGDMGGLACSIMVSPPQ
jgi:hypothetical protein